MRRNLFLFSAIMFSLVCAGCGGGDNTTTRAAAKRGATQDDTEFAAGVGKTKVSGDKYGPTVSLVELSTDRPTVVDDIEVKVETTESDVTMTYQWFINGRENLRHDGSSLRAGTLARDDRAKVVITVADSSGNETRVEAPEVRVVNSQPEITRYPSGDPRDFTFEADDVDGDQISWKMEGAPPGYRIDQRGTVRAGAGPVKPGEYQLKVTASDNEGGSAIFEADIRVDEPAKNEQAAAEPEQQRKKPEDMNEQELDQFQEKWEKDLDKMSPSELREYEKRLEESGY